METLYLIRCNQYYKIGIATNVRNRLAALQTGNPTPLEIEACFEFPNALVVEKALHQTFASVRKLGEWFELGDQDIERFITICRALGGMEYAVMSELETTELEEAEEEQETANAGARWDFTAMFADGWSMHKGNDGDGRNSYWCWRKRGHEKGYIYGGRIADLPLPIDDMRRVYRDGEQP